MWLIKKIHFAWYSYLYHFRSNISERINKNLGTNDPISIAWQRKAAMTLLKVHKYL